MDNTLLEALIAVIGAYSIGNLQGMWIGYRLQFNENMEDN